MKRVKAACILQTLMFAQKPEMGYFKERTLEINRDKVAHYKAHLKKQEQDISLPKKQNSRMLLSLSVLKSSTMTKQTYLNTLAEAQPPAQGWLSFYILFVIYLFFLHI